MRNTFIKKWCLNSLRKKYNLKQKCEVILFLSDWQNLKIQRKSNVSESVRKCSLFVSVGEIVTCASFQNTKVE